MKPITSLTVSAAAWLCATSSLAGAAPPSPAGDWHGTMSGDRGPVRSAVHVVETAPGAFAGDIDLPDNGIWDFPLETVAFTNGTLHFSYRGGTRRFEGQWSETTRAWTGRFHTPGGATDLILKPGFLGLPVIADLDGRWEGALKTGVEPRFILRVATDAHGTHALLDLPHLLETDIPVDLTRQGEVVAFTVPALGMRFDGRFNVGNKTIKGEIGGIPLDFARNDSGAPRKSQTPKPPSPYRTEDIFIPNPAASGVRLGCTLTLPQGPGPHPVTVLLTGTGQQDRDETLVGHKPFLILADHLARHGVAALRCDDRGAGASTGDFHGAALEDFAGDAKAMIDLLKTRPDIDGKRIGLTGHSEGGIVASMVAAERTDIAFVMLIAGPGVPIFELLLSQGEETGRAQGLPEAVVQQQSIVRRAVYEAVRKADTPDVARAQVTALLVSWGVPEEAAKAEAAMATRPDILRIINVDPAASLARVSAPVLAVVGSKDTQVPAAQNIPALRKVLVTNADATVEELPGLNHLLQTARTGAAAEYYSIEETMAPVALDALIKWLAARGLGRRAP